MQLQLREHGQLGLCHTRHSVPRRYPQSAKTIKVATGGVHQQYWPEGTADHCASREAMPRDSARTPPQSATGSIPRTGRSEHLKNAQVQRQVRITQKMPSDLTAHNQNILVPCSSQAAVQSPGVGTPAQPCKRHRSATAPQRNSARDTAVQEERMHQIPSVIENFTPFAGTVTQRSWRTGQTERTQYLRCY